MAFCNKTGSLLRRSVSANNALSGQISMGSMFNAIRCMSSSRIYVSGLSYRIDDQELKNVFASFGDVTDAKIITDNQAATKALTMDGQELSGRNLRVSYATERPSRNFGDSGGYVGGSGGYGDDTASGGRY